MTTINPPVSELKNALAGQHGELFPPEEVDREMIVMPTTGDTPEGRCARFQSAPSSHDWLSRIYDRHAPILKALLLRMLGYEETAETALVQLFVDLSREPQPLQEDDESLGLLVERARKQVLKRPGKGRTNGGANSEAELIGQNGDKPKSALDRLAPRQRLVVEGVFFDGKQIADLAREMGVPYDRIKSSLDRGLETLLQPWGAERRSEISGSHKSFTTASA
jgi:DNA-directed RNA polymerase specialized sigma24 family protein